MKALDISDFKQKDGSPFEPLKGWEYYYNVLEDAIDVKNVCNDQLDMERVKQVQEMSWSDAIKEAAEHLKWSITAFSQLKGHVFVGKIMQSMSVKFSQSLPTAGVNFDHKLKLFNMYINPKFFLLLTEVERLAVITHEIYHILHEHIYSITTDKSDHMRRNKAMDLAINQYIRGLPRREIPEDPNAGKNPNGEGFDSHDWDLEDQGPTEQREKMQAVKDMAQRAMQKCSHDHSEVPGFMKELLEKISQQIKALDAKSILLNTLKKSSPSTDISKTWRRPSRRFGVIAPGSQRSKMPKFEVLIDTSGSISIEEANEFLAVANQFLLTGVESCHINLFHTELYHKEKVKKNFKIEADKFQSGGTDLTSSFKDMIKRKPDLVIILTDGYWSAPNVDYSKMPEIVFVISKGGTEDHPLKATGRTVRYAP